MQFSLNYLTNRSYRVQVNNTLSSTYVAEAGIAQGSVLSCLLYILYIADFPKHNGNLNIKATQFADDVVLSVQSVLTDMVQIELNDYLNKINEYFIKWKIKINVDKCEEIAIVGNVIQTPQKLRKRAKNIELKIDNKIIKKTEKLKYLGIFFTRNYKFNYHLEYIRKKMIAAFFSLKGIFFNKKIEPKIKLLAYKQIIKPIALYGAPIWLQVSRAQINKIALLERKFSELAPDCIENQIALSTTQTVCYIKHVNYKQLKTN